MIPMAALLMCSLSCTTRTIKGVHVVMFDYLSNDEYIY